MSWASKRRDQAALMVQGALYIDDVPTMAYDLTKITHLSSGRVYGALARLEQEGVVERVQQQRNISPREQVDVVAWRLRS